MFPTYDMRSATCEHEAGTRAFHEAPLVLFSALAIAGAGIVAGAMLAPLAGAPVLLRPFDAAVGAVLVVAGLVVSTAHLGRVTRAALALRRFARSPLSTEAVLGALLAAVASLVGIAGKIGVSSPALDWLAIAVAVAFLAALGFVYRLPGQLAWGIESTFSPLAAALLAGVVWRQGWAADGVNSGGAGSFVVPLATAAAIDVVLAGRRWWRIAGALRRGTPSYPRSVRLRRSILVSRLVALDLVAPLLAVSHLPPAALAAALAGLVLDRFGFYALAVRATVEGKIGRVEAVIAGEG